MATLKPSGATVAIYYVHSDQLNTSRQVTRPSDNTPMWTWNAAPFGTDAANPNPAGAGTFAYNLRFPAKSSMGRRACTKTDSGTTILVQEGTLRPILRVWQVA